MKIAKLVLQNFALIYTGMGLYKIVIDFTKCKNNIVLLVGDNGTGKTAIMSNLHPFAYPGSMDVRSNSDIILDRMNEGYKEIHIQNNEDMYVIKHFYTKTTNGRTVKSFISKNGEELNENGNVTSFKELVNLELGLELDFLKLLRLGSNVTTFIDLKAAERKNFISNFLSDVDIYSGFYKKLSDDSRLLKSLLKSVLDKMDKLRITNVKDVEKDISDSEKRLSELISEKDRINSFIWQIDGKIDGLVPDGLEAFVNDFNDRGVELRNIKREISNYNDKLDNFFIIVIGDITEQIMRIEKQMIDKNNEILTNKNMVDFYFKQLDTLYSQKDEKTNLLKSIVSDTEYSKLNNKYVNLVNEKRELDNQFKNYVPICTKEDLLVGLKLMQEIDEYINSMYAFGIDSIKSAINLINENRSVSSEANKQLLLIDRKIQSLNNNLMILNKSNESNKVHIIFKPTTCSAETCSFMDFYNDFESMDKNKTPTDIKAEISRLEKEKEYMIAMNDSSQYIEYIFVLIKSNKDLIEKLPKKFFNTSIILQAIADSEKFYDEEEITSYISIMEDYEHYQNLKQEIKDTKKELLFIEKSNINFSVLQDDIHRLDNEIFKIEKDIEKLKTRNTNIEKEIEDLEELKQNYNKYKDMQDKLDTKKVEYCIVENNIDDMNKLYTKIKEMLDNKKEYTEKLNNINYKIRLVENEIQENKFKLREFENLVEEKNIIEEQFDEIHLIREANSSNKGVPLLYIQLYLRNTRIFINQLLDNIYHGNLEIDDFDINEKEFRIPYNKNGISIYDIVSASQGERSFIMLALSFALMRQSISTYNIMLLDEIDATLDQKNRYEFISMLEKQMDIIGAEQVMLISHNNMFDNYPVDVIRTSPVELDNYKNVNIIFDAAVA